MDNQFVNRKDRIIASAIEIISEAGLSSLTTKNLAMKENMTEALLYRYFGGIDEVLVEVINTFTKFDDSVIATVGGKDISHLDKVLEILKTIRVYYEGYGELAAIVLNYEEFLHNVNTRDAVAACILRRTGFIREELAAAIREGEIIDVFTPEELSNLFLGSISRDLLNRRIRFEGRSSSQVSINTLDKLAELIRRKEIQ